MCLGGCWKEPVLCLPQHIEGFERSKLNLDRLNLTQTHTIAHALTAPVIRLSTNIIWVEWWVFSEMHLFPSHYWRQEGGGGGTGGGLVMGGKGGCYWYAPCGVNTWLISCRHSNDCLLWLICTSCRLPTEHTGNRSMQMSYRPLKEHLAPNQVHLGDALYIAMFNWIVHIEVWIVAIQKKRSITQNVMVSVVKWMRMLDRQRHLKRHCMIAEHGGV